MRRSISGKSRKKARKMVKLNLASMLDIMILLLFFLIKNYSTTGIVVNIPKEISLPLSDSENVNTPGVHVQVSPNTIWVDDKTVLHSAELVESSYDQNGKRLIALYDELVKKRETNIQLQQGSEKAEKFTGNVNLIVDKTVKYNFLKKVLHTCAEAGFVKYKLVIKERFNKLQ